MQARDARWIKLDPRPRLDGNEGNHHDLKCPVRYDPPKDSSILVSEFHVASRFSTSDPAIVIITENVVHGFNWSQV